MLPVLNERMESATAHAKELLSKLSLTEKIGQLSQFGTSIYNNKREYFPEHYPEGKIGSYLTVSGAQITNQLQRDCQEKFPTHIPLLFADDVIHGYRTTMPTPLAQSCSWNPSAAERGAEVAAKEAYVAGLRWTFSPMVDIARDPRWGRIVEGYGEDPYLCSRFAEATVRGYQGKEIGEKYHILACMKHFIGYGACIGGRDYNEVDMSPQTLYDIYLPPFQAGIDAGAATVMSAFHSMNGVPCTGSRHLLTEVLRNECGFDGFVVSDAGAVPELIPHGYAEDWKDAAQKGFQAGVNMLMAGDFYNDYLPQLVAEGKLTEQEIDEALLPILVLKILLGLFESPYTDESEEAKFFFCEEHLSVSREIAKECVVLLENNGILPLQKNQKVALIGPFADEKDHVLGTWSCRKDPEKTVSILEGFRKAGVDVTYAKGCDICEGCDAKLSEAVEIARKSDVAVLVLGEGEDMSGEAKSRTDISLPQIQLKLLDAVLETGVPVVLLISAGRPIVVEDFREKVAALAYIWQLGTSTGDAVAEVMTGRCDVSGRLSVSVPKSVGQIPVYYNYPSTGRPALGKIWYETGYIDENAHSRYPFGYGLSYTEFEYSDLRLSANEMTADGSITINCKVKNVGKRAGKTVVQLYVRDLVGSRVRPIKELKGFEKIDLDAGESRTVTFILQARELAFHNEKMEKVVEPGRFRLWVSKDSREEGISGEFEVV